MRALERLKALAGAAGERLGAVADGKARPSAGAAAGLVTANAAWLLAGGVVAGLLLPPLAAGLRPFVVPLAVFLVLISALSVEPARARAALGRPLHALAVGALVLVALPLAAGLGAWLLGAPAWLSTGLALSAAAPPLFPAAAYAALAGIDAALTTAASLPATLASPFTLWLVKSVKPDAVAVLDMTQLISRLLFIVYGSFGVAFFVRRVVGEEAVARAAPRLDAAATVLLALIGAGAMAEVNAALWATPLTWIGVLVATFAFSLASFAVATQVFRAGGRDEALAAGLAASVKNVAVMVAAAFGAVDGRVIAVVMTAQIPVLLAPLVLRPVLARLGLAAASGGGEAAAAAAGGGAAALPAPEAGAGASAPEAAGDAPAPEATDAAAPTAPEAGAGPAGPRGGSEGGA